VFTLPLIQDHLRPEDRPPFEFVSLRELELRGSTLAALPAGVAKEHNPTQHNPINFQTTWSTTSQTHLEVTQYQQTSHSLSTQNHSISSSPPAHHSNVSLLRKSTNNQSPFQSQNPATTEGHSSNSSSLTAYRCTECHRQFKHRRSQYRHFKVCHTNESLHPCPYCRRRYSRKDILGDHLRNKHVRDQIMEARSNLNNMDTAIAIPGHGLV
jgi:hypothetical protein